MTPAAATARAARRRAAEPGVVRGAARFDRAEVYRYSLRRTWNRHGPRIVWVCLNPNRADATHDDPTIRRCIGFSRRWGFGSLEVVNLFALRARDPKALRSAADPVGPGNDAALRSALRRADCVVAAWGAHGRLGDRDRAAARWLRSARTLRCFGLTRDGQPRHPLYLRGTTRLRAFLPASTPRP